MKIVTDEMQKALDTIVDVETKVAAAVREPIAFRPGGTPNRAMTLAEQLQNLERIDRELIARVRREGVEARNTCERKIADAHADYARNLSEMTAKLERERDEMVRQASDEMHGKLHELAGFVRRRMR